MIRMLDRVVESVFSGTSKNLDNFQRVACDVIDKLYDCESIPADAKRGVLENIIDYARQRQKQLEPSLQQFQEEDD